MKNPKGRCAICVDPVCKGHQDCDCSTCTKREQCYRVLQPIIRITKRCTQTCSHCCFACGPEATEEMPVETAKQIAAFCQANGIQYGSVMGGEFFMHSQWREILAILGKPIQSVRLVSNGDWAGQTDQAADVIGFLKSNRQYRVSLSNDCWHTNRHVAEAERLCKEAGVVCNVAAGEDSNPNVLVPVGRSAYEWCGFYGMFSTYCSKPERKYSFLIDEQGKVFKCGFGAWPYAEVKDYLQGGFSKRFREFNTAFYKEYIPNCAACQRCEQRAKRAA